MTAPNAVRPATAIADPNDPSNVLIPNYSNAVVVGLTQTTAYATPFKALYIGTGGNVKVDLVGTGTGITYKAIPNGTWLAVRVKTIYTTGTTAKSIIGHY